MTFGQPEMSVMGKAVRGVAIIFASLTTVVFIRTFTLETKDELVEPCSRSDIDFIPASDAIIARFQQALRYETVARSTGDYNTAELQKLADFIEKEYPTIHTSSLVSHEKVAKYSILYSIKGSNSSLTPYLLMAHLDVVPAEPDRWDIEPFSADIKDGFIYGRGTIDFKQGVMGILEALEFALQRGHRPKRPFYVAFGHDEEVSGEDGAKAVSDLLWERGVQKFEFLLDEGLTVTNDIVPGMAEQVALIGTSEKGQAWVELSVEMSPGHSSMPPPESAIGILATAITRLEKNPQPSMLGYGPEKDTFTHLAPYMKFPFRMVMTNLWLFKPLISWIMSRKPSTNAVIRTVTAVTMFQAGIKINVNAPVAKAYVNHRIHPAQTIEEVLEYDRKIINDDRVNLRLLFEMESHPMSASGETDFGYQTIKSSIRQVWNRTRVAPATMIGNTDTRHYLRMCSNVYRFSPTVMWPSDVPRFHGDNERMSLKNYEQVVNFYYHVMLNADKAELHPLHRHGEL